MKVGIIGVGVVGGALNRYLERNSKHTILCSDPALAMNDDVTAADAVFICVPVPNAPIGGPEVQDLSIVRESIGRIKSANPSIPVFIRSSVLPETCDQLSQEFGVTVIALPEFLTERTCDADFEEQPILAGTAGSLMAHAKLCLIFDKKTVHPVLNKEAELAKYTHNCFGALKVTYFNSIYQFCTRLGISYENVLKGALLSGYINKPHTQVPGPDGKFGYGGKCFPKDMEAFGYNNNLLREASRINEIFRITSPCPGK